MTHDRRLFHPDTEIGWSPPSDSNQDTAFEAQTNRATNNRWIHSMSQVVGSLLLGSPLNMPAVESCENAVPAPRQLKGILMHFDILVSTNLLTYGLRSKSPTQKI